MEAYRDCVFNKHYVVTIITTGFVGLLLVVNGLQQAYAAELCARIENTANGLLLVVNGERVPPVIFFVNLDTSENLRPAQLEEIKHAGKYGFDIVSFPVPLSWPREGEEYNFEEADRRIKFALQVNQNVLIIPRVGLSWPPQWWCEKHPEELMLYEDGSRGIASIHSELWRRESAKHFAALIRHLEAKYGAHMVGYHPCGQNTGEWFFDRTWEGKESGFEEPAQAAFRRFLQRKYKSDDALRVFWGDPQASIDSARVPTYEERCSSSGCFRELPKEQKIFDFDQFRNETMADTAEYFCRVVKENAPNKLAMVFYGYHFELAPAPHGLQSTGHLALGRLLRSVYVDIVCSPVSYFDRGPGGGGYLMAPVDSAHLAGKLWLVEDDTRTHLGTREPTDPVVYMKDFSETEGVLKRNFAHVVTRGAGIWWMDLYGRGWYSGDEIWRLLEHLQKMYASVLPKKKKYHPEVAIVVDERSCFYLSRSGEIMSRLLALFRKEWYRIGAPVGIYLLDDLVAGRVPPAKLYVFLDTFAIDKHQAEAIRRFACIKGCVLVWMYAPGIFADGSYSLENVIKLVGINLKEDSAASGKIVLVNGEEFDAQHEHLNPSFQAVDPEVEILARYASGGGVAVAARKFAGYTSVYSGVLQLPVSLLCELARRAGVHIYCESGHVVAADDGLVAVHASLDGSVSLKLPAGSRLRECITGQNTRESDTCSFEVDKGDTIILRWVK
ncbi:MAG: beta-galactosidase [Armatimonadota bacterium]